MFSQKVDLNSQYFELRLTAKEAILEEETLV